MPVPESTAAVVTIPLHVKDQLLVPEEEDYSVSTPPAIHSAARVLPSAPVLMTSPHSVACLAAAGGSHQRVRMVGGL